MAISVGLGKQVLEGIMRGEDLEEHSTKAGEISELSQGADSSTSVHGLRTHFVNTS